MPAEDYWATFFNPECLLDALDCDEHCGDVVEFGCGYGTFTTAAAGRISGIVHALDIDPGMVEMTTRRIAEIGLANAGAEQRDFVRDGSGCPDESVDYAMLFNILHIEEPITLLREAFRSLKLGGVAGIVHWNYDPSTPRGPSMEIRPRPEQCRDWAVAAGFEFVRFESLDCCPHHYGLVVRRGSSV